MNLFQILKIQYLLTRLNIISSNSLVLDGIFCVCKNKSIFDFIFCLVTPIQVQKIFSTLRLSNTSCDKPSQVI